MYAHWLHLIQLKQGNNTSINDINLENITRGHCIGISLKVNYFNNKMLSLGYPYGSGLCNFFGQWLLLS